MKIHGRRIPLMLVVGGCAAVLLAGCVQGPPSADQVAGEFDDTITPAWTVDVPGIYGSAAIADDMIAVYAQDKSDGLRLEVHDTGTGELLWKHVASPGGAWGAPLFSETTSASRPYPIPAIQPFVVSVGSGEKAKPMVVFTERVLTETNEIYNPDILHVADLRTGDELELSAPDFAGLDSPFGAAEPDDDGNILVQPYSPYRVCGDEPSVCFEDSEGGFFHVDLTTGAVTNTEPEFDPFDSGYSRDWGAEYVRVGGDAADKAGDTLVAKLDGGEEAWRIGADDLFGDAGGSPAELRDFQLAGGLLLIQGYRSILNNMDDRTFEYDYAQSRTLAAVDPDTGEVAWTAPGVDSLCFAVDGAARTADADVIPVCHATGGSFYYDYQNEKMLDQEPPEVSIAGLDLSDGSLTWEVAHAGDQAILEHGRQLDAVFASGRAFAVVDTASADDGDQAPEVGVLDLATGDLRPVPAKAGFICESEREGVKLEFQGSVFVSGSNPIALEYPAGWYQFACDQDAAPAKTWTKGAVRVAGLAAPGNRYVVVTQDGLAGFAL